MIVRSLLALTLTASVALAGNSDLKAPPPLPKKERSCLKVQGFERCIPVEPHILRLYKLKSGAAVPPAVMLDIDEENRAFLRTKLR